MSIKVICKPFVIRNGLRVLQCHSKGDRRFSPFCCYLSVNGKHDSIENHYQRSKAFDDGSGDWRFAKARKGQLFKWSICGHKFPLVEQLGGEFTVGVQFYIAMWYKHLRLNPQLIEIARDFDEFEDPFKGTFPFCQADIIRLVVRNGIKSLKPLCQPLLDKLS